MDIQIRLLSEHTLNVHMLSGKGEHYDIEYLSQYDAQIEDFNESIFKQLLMVIRTF